MRLPPFHPGDPAPTFVAPSTSNPRYAFDTAAGRYVVLCFLGSAGQEDAAAALRTATEGHRRLFDDDRVCLFAVSVDPDDQRLGRLVGSMPGIRVFWDFDLGISRLYGASGAAPDAAGVPAPYSRFWLVLDPMLRVLLRAPLAEAGAVVRFAAALPPPGAHGGAEAPAPVLLLPRVLEPEFCRRLIALYDARGGQESGFMRDVGGRTVGLLDPLHKRRRDCPIEDEELRAALRARVQRRLVPEILKAFQFRATRVERYIVARYDAAEGGHFRAHRDNTTAGTAHRRFAVSINLNDDFDGGDLRFPEFGPRRHRPPAGGAVVFSCSLLHEATRVTRGLRYATLPFLYDDAAAELRERNARFVGAAEGGAGGAGADAG